MPRVLRPEQGQREGGFTDLAGTAEQHHLFTEIRVDGVVQVSWSGLWGYGDIRPVQLYS